MQVTRKQEWIRLVFVGSPLLDITASCGEALLTRYNLKADGCVVATDHHDDLFRNLLRDSGSRLDAGGSALNSARIAKWATGDKGRVSFVGCVGEDEYAHQISKELQLNGVEPLFVSLPGIPTGICACLLSFGGQRRSMCTRRGAADLLKKDHLLAIEGRLEEANCIFVVGYLLSHSPDVVFELAIKRQSTQIFALSLSAEYVCRDFTDAILQVLPEVDVLLGNELEITALAEALDISSTVEESASVVANLSGTRIVVVSRGPDSVVLVKGKEAPRHFVVPQNIPVVDSVGCGDALAGAFLGVFALTGDPDEAVRAGIKAAVEIAQTHGCNPPSKNFMNE